MLVAIVGATGLVGQKMLEILAERKFPVAGILPVASERSVGQKVKFYNQEYPVINMETALALKPELALFSAGAAVSRQWAPVFEQMGTVVIDNSSAWRMDPAVKLVVPEVNAEVLKNGDRIIANPNCSTIQMVVALKPLHDRYKIKRVVVSTYQAVTGTGKVAVDQLMHERRGIDGPKAYPYAIDLNVLPQVDVFLENGYTKEEMKMVLETKKIMGDESIAITATTVRVPVFGGHSESVNVEFEHEFELAGLRSLLEGAKGVKLTDDTAGLVYPMPLTAENKDEVFVGRLRRDESQPKTLNMWIVADNLRKGAATNAVQIAEYMLEKGLLV